MKHHYSVLLLLLLPLNIYATPPELKVEGLKGDLANNVNLLVSLIKINDSTNEQEIKSQFSTAIQKGLRAKGYYQPKIQFTDEKNLLGKSRIVAHVQQGLPVHIAGIVVTIEGEAKTDRDYQHLLTQQPKIGAILDHGTYDTFKSNLTSLALRKGYFGAEITKSELAVAPQLHQAFWNIDYHSGPRYRFGEVEFNGSQIDERYLRPLIPFKQGDYYTSEQLAQFNQQLSASNWFKSVVISPKIVETLHDNQIPIQTLLTPQTKNKVELGGGYETDIGPRAKIGWRQPWVNDRGQSFDVNTTLSMPEQTIDFNYKIPLVSDPLAKYYALQAGLRNEDHNDTRSQEITLNVARYWNSSIAWQKAVNLRWDQARFTQGGQHYTTMLLLPGVSLDRTRQRGEGMVFWGDSQHYSIDLSQQRWGSDIDFLILQAQNIWIRTLQTRHRFIARGTMGWIETSHFSQVPPSLRFFAGGDRSIRGYKYKSVSPKNAEGKLIGGSSTFTASLEYQYNVIDKWWGAVFFDAGEVGTHFKHTEIKKGAGIGIHWQTLIGPIRFDLARPIGDKEKQGIQFYIGIGPEL